METPILTTKLYAPRVRPELVPRSRLVARLNAGLHRKLSLISAPAGFGKTTLLSEWGAQCERPVGWLSLDEGDNDISLFWAYLIAALQKASHNIRSITQTTFQSPSLPAIKSALTVLINQIAEKAEPFVLILDDYHVINAPIIHKLLTFLLEHQPPQMHLVIATRADPPLPLARLRGRGQITELYHSDLRFTTPEAATFLEKSLHIQLSPEAVTALEQRTEGWIAGLQMAAVSMQRHENIAEFIQAFTGSHRYIFDYLLEEVLRHQPKEVRHFLLQTSILERLTVPLCEAVIGAHTHENLQDKLAPTDASHTIHRAVDILNYLERNNLFTLSLDDAQHWYRYHQLFADLLRQRLQRETPDLVPELHRRASKWYAQNECIAEAVNHALAARDFEWTTHLIQKTGWATFTRGEMSTLLGWITALPKDVVRTHPQLSILYAWAMAKSGQLDSTSGMNSVESCMKNLDPHRWRGDIAAIRAYVAGVQGNLSQAVTLAEQALEHLPKENLYIRAIVAQNLGVAYHWSGDPTSAIQMLTKAAELSHAANQAYQRLTTMAILGRAHEMRGALRQAAETYKEALKLASEPDKRPVPFAGMAYIGMASVLYERNELDDAACYAKEGIRLSELGGFIAYQIFGYGLLARICEAQGARNDALDKLQKAKHLGQGESYALVIALAAELQVQLWLRQGNVASAVRWLQEHNTVAHDKLDAAAEVEQMVKARVLIIQGKFNEALNLLTQLFDATQDTKRTGSAIKILILQALTFQAQDHVDSAVSALEHALSLAESEGYMRIFIDEGEPMAQLLRQTLSRGITPNYVARLLAAFEETDKLAPHTVSPLAEPLTDRERDVLRLIVAGLSNQEIADQLFIAISTVKSHVNHIYGKLAVENRAQAVIQAQELHLL